MNAPFFVPTSSSVRVMRNPPCPMAYGCLDMEPYRNSSADGSTAVLEGIHDPVLGRFGEVIRGTRDLGTAGLEVEDYGRRGAAGLTDSLGDGMDRRAAVPDLVDDQDPLATEQRVGGELEERRPRARLALVVVELDRRDEDVPDPEAIGEHPGRDEAAAGDREHEVVVGRSKVVGELADHVVQVVLGDVVFDDFGGHVPPPYRPAALAIAAIVVGSSSADRSPGSSPR